MRGQVEADRLTNEGRAMPAGNKYIVTAITRGQSGPSAPWGLIGKNENILRGENGEDQTRNSDMKCGQRTNLYPIILIWMCFDQQWWKMERTRHFKML